MKKTTELVFIPEYFEYRTFIQKCFNKIYSKKIVLHKHHIIPIHLLKLNEIDKKDNTVKLSVDDHIIAHVLLSKCFTIGSYENVSNLQSARLLKNKSIKFTDEMSELVRKSYIGENNPFYGKTHSEETKLILSKKSHDNFIGKSYEERYGKNADIEREKRKQGVLKSWNNISKKERDIRCKNISDALIGKNIGSSNGYAQPIMVDDIYFGSLSEAKEHFGISRYKLYSRHTVIKLNKNKK